MINHIVRMHKLSSQQYYDQYIGKRKSCCEIENCQNETRWIDFNKLYNKYCPKHTQLSYKLRWTEERRLKYKHKNRFPNRTGIPHTLKTKQKISKGVTKAFIERGITNRPKCGKFIPININKYKGNIHQILYRSSWELHYMKQLDNDTDVIEWSNEELSIQYYDNRDGYFRNYIPDFLIKRHDCTEMIEIKPYLQTIPPISGGKESHWPNNTWRLNDLKWKEAKIYCDKLGWKFSLLTEHELFKG